MKPKALKKLSTHTSAGYAFSAPMLFFLDSFLKNGYFKYICETGSGCSTVVIADYCKRSNASFVSLETKEKFKKRTVCLLNKFDLKEFSENVKLVKINKDTQQYVDLPEFNVDLLLVDGPSRLDADRYGLMFGLWGKLNNKCWILVDDVHRKRDKLNIDAWVENIDGFKFRGIKTIKTRCIAICQKLL